MWEWGRRVAEYAAAAAWTSARAVETEPTILDPEYWEPAPEGSEGSAGEATTAPVPWSSLSSLSSLRSRSASSTRGFGAIANRVTAANFGLVG